MKTAQVTVHFANGLHARTAVHLVKVLKKYKAQVTLRVGNRVSNGRSILGILLLAATLNTQLEVQASGQDEDAAISATAVFFQQTDENLTAQIPAPTVPDEQSGASL